MIRNKTITIKISKEERAILERAAKVMGMGHTTLLRVSALEKARKLNKQTAENGTIPK